MRKKPLFYRIYFTVIAVFLVCLIAGLCVLYAALNTYENSRPDTVAERYFEEYIKTGDMLKDRSPAELHLSRYESREEAGAALKNLIKGKKLDCIPLSHGTQAENPEYSVTADGKALFTVALTRQKEKGAFGIRGYDVGDVSIAPEFTRNIKIFAPSNAEITVNGISLDEKPEVTEELPDVLKKISGSDKFPSPCLWKLDGFLCGEPEVEAGDGFTVAQDGENRTVAESGAEIGEIGEYAVEAAQTYAAFMQNDMPFARVAQYLDATTEFYAEVRATPSAFVWEHDGYSFRDVKYGEFFRYGEDVCRCRVTFTQVLHRGATTYEDVIDHYVYLQKESGKWKVLEIATAEAGQ